MGSPEGAGRGVKDAEVSGVRWSEHVAAGEMLRARGGGARGAAEPRVLAGSKSLCDPWPSPRVKVLSGLLCVRFVWC
jgi:hypothetical protein